MLVANTIVRLPYMFWVKKFKFGYIHNWQLLFCLCNAKVSFNILFYDQLHVLPNECRFPVWKYLYLFSHITLYTFRNECKAQIDKFKQPKFKKFDTKEDALLFISSPGKYMYKLCCYLLSPAEKRFDVVLAAWQSGHTGFLLYICLK